MTGLARYRKAIAAAVGALAEIVALGVLPEQYQSWATTLIAVATAAGVYAVPNEPPAP